MVLWDIVLLAYGLIAAAASFMTLREYHAKKVLKPLGLAAGLALCAAWPVAIAAVMVTVSARSASITDETGTQKMRPVEA